MSFFSYQYNPSALNYTQLGFVFKMTNVVLLFPERKKNEYKAGVDWCKSHVLINKTVSSLILEQCTGKRWEQRSSIKERASV